MEHAIMLCKTRAEYEAIIKATKENLCFETAVTDFETIRSECEKIAFFVDPYEIYGVVYVG